MSICQANENRGCRSEFWAENRGGWVAGGEEGGVCLCGIRQGLACMTWATSFLPGKALGLPRDGSSRAGQQAG